MTTSIAETIPGATKHADFAGAVYDPATDKNRLTKQVGRVFMAIEDGVWRTLEEIHGITGDPVASVSAQLRHLRKPQFGAHTIERRHRGNGLYEYRLAPKPAAASIVPLNQPIEQG